MNKVMWLVRVQSIHNGASVYRCPTPKSLVAVLAMFFKGIRLKAFLEVLKNEGTLDFDNGYLAIQVFTVKETKNTPGLTLAEAEDEAGE